MRSLALSPAVTHLGNCWDQFLPGSLQTAFQYCVTYVFDLSDNHQKMIKDYSKKEMYGLARIHIGMHLDVSEKGGQKDHIIGENTGFLSLISFSQ